MRPTNEEEQSTPSISSAFRSRQGDSAGNSDHDDRRTNLYRNLHRLGVKHVDNLKDIVLYIQPDALILHPMIRTFGLDIAKMNDAVVSALEYYLSFVQQRDFPYRVVFPSSKPIGIFQHQQQQRVNFATANDSRKGVRVAEGDNDVQSLQNDAGNDQDTIPDSEMT